MIVIRRSLAIPLALILAVLAQLVLVQRAPLPGGGTPNLVLLVVTALAVTLGPMTGMLAGFCGGLALDIAPPGGHLAGEYALVFCLVGYAAGRLRPLADPMEEHGGVASLTVMVLGVAAGEAGIAVLGRMVSDPEVTLTVVKHVLPAAVVYDVLLSPFVLWLISVAVRGRTPAAARAPQRKLMTAPQHGAIRLAAAGAAPKLRLGNSAPPASMPVAREPRLRFASGRSALFGRTDNGVSPASPSSSRGRAVRLNFGARGRGGLIGGSALAASLSERRPLSEGAPPRGWLRAAGKPAGPAVRSTSPPRGWLRAAGKPAGPAVRSTSPPRGWLRAAGKPAGPAVRSTSPPRGWLRAAGKPAGPAVRSTSPPRGWLRAGKPAAANWRRRSPGKGWLRGSQHSRGYWLSRNGDYADASVIGSASKYRYRRKRG